MFLILWIYFTLYLLKYVAHALVIYKDSVSLFWIISYKKYNFFSILMIKFSKKIQIDSFYKISYISFSNRRHLIGIFIFNFYLTIILH